jgi:hypothetical protein
VERLMSSIGGAPALRNLTLGNTYMGHEGFVAVVAALREGRLARLAALAMWDEICDCEAVVDDDARDLAGALAEGGGRHLQRLLIHFDLVTIRGARAIARAAAAHCPALQELDLSFNGETSARIKALQALVYEAGQTGRCIRVVDRLSAREGAGANESDDDGENLVEIVAMVEGLQQGSITLGGSDVIERTLQGWSSKQERKSKQDRRLN